MARSNAFVISQIILLALTVGSSFADINGTDKGIVCGGKLHFKKYIICYSRGDLPPEKIDPCACTHLVLTGWALSENLELVNNNMSGNFSFVSRLKEKNPELRVLISLSDSTDESSQLIGQFEQSINASNSSVTDIVRDFLVNNTNLDGVEIDTVSKRRQDRDIFVQLLKNLREALDDDSDNETTSRYLLGATVSTDPATIVDAYDLANMSRYLNYIFLPAFNFTVEEGTVLFHHSRLMGISDFENADSMVDLFVSLGLQKEKLVLGVPTFGVSFNVSNSNETSPRSPASGNLTNVPYKQICQDLATDDWIVERDDDQTGVRAYKNNTWVGYDDPLSIRIKSKYIILRDLAGIGIKYLDDDDISGVCTNKRFPLVMAARDTLATLDSVNQKRVMDSLERDLEFSATEEHLVVASTTTNTPADVDVTTTIDSVNTTDAGGDNNTVVRDRRSIYRVTQIVDRTGKIHVVTPDGGETHVECTRQGYYRDPLDCSRFHRCVKFNQYKEDFTVFEYDCPAGLVFDERYGVCSWPSAAPPCVGSSEIFPVPKRSFVCPAEGFFRDPENCRWFYKCSDFYGNGSLTAFEFRCPFGLAFDERSLICNWKWMTDPCPSDFGYVGISYSSGLSPSGRQGAPLPSFSHGNSAILNSNSAIRGQQQRAFPRFPSAGLNSPDSRNIQFHQSGVGVVGSVRSGGQDHNLGQYSSDVTAGRGTSGSGSGFHGQSKESGLRKTGEQSGNRGSLAAQDFLQTTDSYAVNSQGGATQDFIQAAGQGTVDAHGGGGATYQARDQFVPPPKSPVPTIVGIGGSDNSNSNLANIQANTKNITPNYNNQNGNSTASFSSNSGSSHGIQKATSGAASATGQSIYNQGFNTHINSYVPTSSVSHSNQHSPSSSQTELHRDQYNQGIGNQNGAGVQDQSVNRHGSSSASNSHLPPGSVLGNSQHSASSSKTLKESSAYSLQKDSTNHDSSSGGHKTNSDAGVSRQSISNQGSSTFSNSYVPPGSVLDGNRHSASSSQTQRESSEYSSPRDSTNHESSSGAQKTNSDVGVSRQSISNQGSNTFSNSYIPPGSVLDGNRHSASSSQTQRESSEYSPQRDSTYHGSSSDGQKTKSDVGVSRQSISNQGSSTFSNSYVPPGSVLDGNRHSTSSIQSLKDYSKFSSQGDQKNQDSTSGNQNDASDAGTADQSVQQRGSSTFSNSYIPSGSVLSGNRPAQDNQSSTFSSKHSSQKESQAGTLTINSAVDSQVHSQGPNSYSNSYVPHGSVLGPDQHSDGIQTNAKPIESFSENRPSNNPQTSSTIINRNTGGNQDARFSEKNPYSISSRNEASNIGGSSHIQSAGHHQTSTSQVGFGGQTVSNTGSLGYSQSFVPPNSMFGSLPSTSSVYGPSRHMASSNSAADQNFSRPTSTTLPQPRGGPSHQDHGQPELNSSSLKVLTIDQEEKLLSSSQRDSSSSIRGTPQDGLSSISIQQSQSSIGKPTYGNSFLPPGSVLEGSRNKPISQFDDINPINRDYQFGHPSTVSNVNENSQHSGQNNEKDRDGIADEQTIVSKSPESSTLYLNVPNNQGSFPQQTTRIPVENYSGKPSNQFQPIPTESYSDSTNVPIYPGQRVPLPEPIVLKGTLNINEKFSQNSNATTSKQSSNFHLSSSSGHTQKQSSIANIGPATFGGQTISGFGQNTYSNAYKPEGSVFEGTGTRKGQEIISEHTSINTQDHSIESGIAKTSSHQHTQTSLVSSKQSTSNTGPSSYSNSFKPEGSIFEGLTKQKSGQDHDNETIQASNLKSNYSGNHRAHSRFRISSTQRPQHPTLLNMHLLLPLVNETETLIGQAPGYTRKPIPISTYRPSTYVGPTLDTYITDAKIDDQQSASHDEQFGRRNQHEQEIHNQRQGNVFVNNYQESARTVPSKPRVSTFPEWKNILISRTTTPNSYKPYISGYSTSSTIKPIIQFGQNNVSTISNIEASSANFKTENSQYGDKDDKKYIPINFENSANTQVQNNNYQNIPFNRVSRPLVPASVPAYSGFLSRPSQSSSYESVGHYSPAPLANPLNLYSTVSLKQSISGPGKFASSTAANTINAFKSADGIVESHAFAGGGSINNVQAGYDQRPSANPLYDNYPANISTSGLSDVRTSTWGPTTTIANFVTYIKESVFGSTKPSSDDTQTQVDVIQQNRQHGQPLITTTRTTVTLENKVFDNHQNQRSNNHGTGGNRQLKVTVQTGGHTGYTSFIPLEVTPATKSVSGLPYSGFVSSKPDNDASLSAHSKAFGDQTLQKINLPPLQTHSSAKTIKEESTLPAGTIGHQPGINKNFQITQNQYAGSEILMEQTPKESGTTYGYGLINFQDGGNIVTKQIDQKTFTNNAATQASVFITTGLSGSHGQSSSQHQAADQNQSGITHQLGSSGGSDGRLKNSDQINSNQRARFGDRTQSHIKIGAEQHRGDHQNNNSGKFGTNYNNGNSNLPASNNQAGNSDQNKFVYENKIKTPQEDSSQIGNIRIGGHTVSDYKAGNINQFGIIDQTRRHSQSRISQNKETHQTESSIYSERGSAKSSDYEEVKQPVSDFKAGSHIQSDNRGRTEYGGQLGSIHETGSVGQLENKVRNQAGREKQFGIERPSGGSLDSGDRVLSKVGNHEVNSGQLGFGYKTGSNGHPVTYSQAGNDGQLGIGFERINDSQTRSSGESGSGHQIEIDEHLGLQENGNEQSKHGSGAVNSDQASKIAGQYGRGHQGGTVSFYANQPDIEKQSESDGQLKSFSSQTSSGNVGISGEPSSNPQLVSGDTPHANTDNDKLISNLGRHGQQETKITSSSEKRMGSSSSVVSSSNSATSSKAEFSTLQRSEHIDYRGVGGFGDVFSSAHHGNNKNQQSSSSGESTSSEKYGTTHISGGSLTSPSHSGSLSESEIHRSSLDLQKSNSATGKVIGGLPTSVHERQGTNPINRTGIHSSSADTSIISSHIGTGRNTGTGSNKYSAEVNIGSNRKSGSGSGSQSSSSSITGTASGVSAENKGTANIGSSRNGASEDSGFRSSGSSGSRSTISGSGNSGHNSGSGASDSTYVGPIVCERAGLFRHPHDCTKFYECYWDRWIKRFTLHFFDCPIRLVYDEHISGCNWPVNGPTCQGATLQ